jgi:hypothetical protein
MQSPIKGMQSTFVALLAPEGGVESTLLFRRGDGQFAMARIDARLGAAARLAAAYVRARGPVAVVDAGRDANVNILSTAKG